MSSWYTPQMQCERNWKMLFHSHGGLFYGEDSVVRVLPFTMVRLTLFFVISQALHRVFKPLKQTEYISKMMAGIILGPGIFGRYKRYGGISDIPSQVQFISVMGYFGLLYHIFIISVKTDTSMLLRFRKQFWIMGISSMVPSYVAMYILLVIFKPITFSYPTYAYIFAVQMSSAWFISLVPLLDELHILATEFGQLSLTLSLTHEFLVWSNGIFFLIWKATSALGLLKSALPIAVYISVIVGVVRPIILWIIKTLPSGQHVKEIYVIGTFVAAAISALFCDYLIGSPLMGIVFFGLAVPHGPPLGLAIVERGETFIDNCLLPFFFLAVGESVDFTIKDVKGHMVCQIIIIIGYLIKTLTTTLCAMWYNLRPREGIALGLILNTSGVVHFMAYWNWLIRQTINNQVSSQFILSSVLVTSLMTPLAFYFHKQAKRDSNSIQGFQLSVQSALMSSTMHILVCVDIEEDIPGIINLLKASNPTTAYPIGVYLIHLIELVGQAAPILIPHKKHNRICRYNGCVPITNAVKSYCDSSEGGVTIQFLTMIAPFTSMHEGICKLAEEKLIPLVIVPFIYKSQNHSVSSASSQLNSKLQHEIPCTLGIFVNKGTSNKQLNQSFFSYHVAVIFCGGEDDREALTYATRMSTHPGVSVTLLRIFIKEYDDKTEGEILLDDSVVDKFKTKTMNNACAFYKEFQVEEWLQTINVVQSLEKTYDLVMVGRRHGPQALWEDDFYVLSENPELGEVGELIVSGELPWENTSFLVMQHCSGSEKETMGNIVLLDES